MGATAAAALVPAAGERQPSRAGSGQAGPGRPAGRSPPILRGDVAAHRSRARACPAGARGPVAAVLAALGPAPAGGRVLCLLRSRGAGAPGRGRAGERGWAAAVLMRTDRLIQSAVAAGVAGGPYEPGLLALREGPLLEAAVRALAEPLGLLIVHAAGRDHPRAAGLALQLGAVLDLPSIGVTDRPLQATGAEPGPERGGTSRLLRNGVEAAGMLRTRAGARPLVVHPGWRTDLDTAISVALESTRRVRTPEPLGRARSLASQARTAAEAGLHG
jgi:deoxyribonuclease V